MSSFDQETGRDRYFAQRERELDALIDPATGLVDERYAHRVACPVCGSDEHRTLFVKRGFPIVRCDACRLVFSNPQVDESLVVEEYRGGLSNDLWVDVLTSERQLALDREKFGAILDELEPHRGAGRLLDVGCSIGLFLEQARGRGWDGVGIEFSEKARSYARAEFGLEVIDRPLAESGLEPESFDVVTLLSVLEHTTEPRRMLREIATVLKPAAPCTSSSRTSRASPAASCTSGPRPSTGATTSSTSPERRCPTRSPSRATRPSSRRPASPRSTRCWSGSRTEEPYSGEASATTRSSRGPAQPRFGDARAARPRLQAPLPRPAPA